jgi:chromosome segregation ATPase
MELQETKISVKDTKVAVAEAQREGQDLQLAISLLHSRLGECKEEERQKRQCLADINEDVNALVSDVQHLSLAMRKAG